MLAELTRDNVELGRKHGGTDDSANVYAMHNLGEGDGGRILKALKANPQMSVRDALVGGREIGEKEKARIEAVIGGNDDLYKGGNITVQEAYQHMGKAMASGQAFADKMAPSAAAATPAEKKIPAIGRTIYGNGAAASSAQAVSAISAQSIHLTPAGIERAAGIATEPARESAVKIPSPKRYTPPEPSTAAQEATRRIDSAPADGGRRTTIIEAPTGQNVPDRHIANIISGGIGMQ
jgi:hypothetical protein